MPMPVDTLMPVAAPGTTARAGLLSQVTMLVPTRNRHGYLQNILETYAGTGLNLIVADTSPAPLPGVERYENVRYQHFSQCRFADKLRFLVQAAPTPYIVLRAENRHLTVEGIARCLERLLACPDCSLVHGAHVWVRQKRGKLEAWPCYDGDGLAGLMHERPEERLLAAFNPMVSLYYAVERRQNLLDVLDLATGIDNLNAFEILLTAVKAINGKCAREPVLFCAVQERPSALKASPLYDGFDLVASQPEYAEEYGRVRTAIAGHLALKSGLNLPRCEAITQESLDNFLRNHCAGPKRSTGEKLRSTGERLRRKAGRLVDSGLRLLGLPDAKAQRVLDEYLGGLEGDGRARFQALLATIERGYREGW